MSKVEVKQEVLDIDTRMKEFQKEYPIREIVMRDLRLFTKYLTSTGLKDQLIDTFFSDQSSNIGVDSWADLREKLGLSAEELDQLKTRSNNDLVLAVNIHPGAVPYRAKERTVAELYVDIIEIVYDLIDDDNKYELTVDLIANLYQLEKEEVETVSIETFVFMVMGIIKNENFTIA